MFFWLQVTIFKSKFDNDQNKSEVMPNIDESESLEADDDI